MFNFIRILSICSVFSKASSLIFKTTEFNFHLTQEISKGLKRSARFLPTVAVAFPLSLAKASSNLKITC